MADTPPDGLQRRSMRDRIADAATSGVDQRISDLAIPPAVDPAQLTSTSMTSIGSLADMSTAFTVGDEGGLTRTSALAPISAPLDVTGPAGVIDLADARAHHLLLIADDVEAAEIEALALSIWDVASWEGAGLLHLTNGARLEGPWTVDVATRKELGTPASFTRAWVLRCPASRRNPVAPGLAALDDWSRAFPDGVPSGLEYRVLVALRRMARRLGAGLRIADSGALIAPDPDSAVSLAIYTPRWLDPPDLMAALEPEFPRIIDSRDVMIESPHQPSAAQIKQIEEAKKNLGPARMDVATKIAHVREESERHEQRGEAPVVSGYATMTPIANRSDLMIEVHPVPRPPQVLRWESWTTGVIIEYRLRWLPGGSMEFPATGMSRTARLERMRSARDIEKAAGILVSIVGGSVIDEDGFLVGLEEQPVGEDSAPEPDADR